MKNFAQMILEKRNQFQKSLLRTNPRIQVQVDIFVVFQIYDAGDFSLLCSLNARPGESWRGGDFLATDRVIVWNSKGVAFIYRLPTK